MTTLSREPMFLEVILSREDVERKSQELAELVDELRNATDAEADRRHEVKTTIDGMRLRLEKLAIVVRTRKDHQYVDVVAELLDGVVRLVRTDDGSIISTRSPTPEELQQKMIIG